jgi:hypothetical protein
MGYAFGTRTTQPSSTSSARASPIRSTSAFPSSTRSRSVIVQSSSPSLQKYSRPRLDLPGSGTIPGLQFLKFWMRPTFTAGECT